MTNLFERFIDWVTFMFTGYSPEGMNLYELIDFLQVRLVIKDIVCPVLIGILMILLIGAMVNFVEAVKEMKQSKKDEI